MDSDPIVAAVNQQKEHRRMCIASQNDVERSKVTPAVVPQYKSLLDALVKWLQTWVAKLPLSLGDTTHQFTSLKRRFFAHCTATQL